jgi:hypothetical protein
MRGAFTKVTTTPSGVPKKKNTSEEETVVAAVQLLVQETVLTVAETGASLAQLWTVCDLLGVEFRFVQRTMATLDTMATLVATDDFVGFLLILPPKTISPSIEVEHWVSMRQQPDDTWLLNHRTGRQQP